MTAELRKFLNQYSDFAEIELDEIIKKFKKRQLSKNEYLLREGEVCRDLVFVQSGCLRLFYLADDIEVSVWFSFEHNSSIEIHSFISEQPTNYFIQAIEETEILFLSKIELEKLYNSFPKMQEMMRKYWEDVVLNLIERFTSLQRDSAEKRYRDLLKKPQYMQTIPQKYLASFIGVTPTSLSRIRKKIR